MVEPHGIISPKDQTDKSRDYIATNDAKWRLDGTYVLIVSYLTYLYENYVTLNLRMMNITYDGYFAAGLRNEDSFQNTLD